MRIKHRLNPGYFDDTNTNAVSDRYQGEIDATVRRAEKAWRKAEKALARAETMAKRRPEPALYALRDEARRLVLQRLDELRRLQALMSAPVGGANRSGRGSVRAVPRKSSAL